MVNNTFWLWIWYFVALIVAWIIIWAVCKSKISGAMAFFAASLFALVVGLILLPYFYHPLLNGGEKASLTAFVVVAILLPFAGLIIWGILKKGKDAMDKSRQAKKDGIKHKEEIIVENPCTGDAKLVGERLTCTDGNNVTRIFRPSVDMHDDFDVGQSYYRGSHY